MHPNQAAYSGIEDEYELDEAHAELKISIGTAAAIIGAVLMLALGFAIMGAIEAIVPRKRRSIR